MSITLEVAYFNSFYLKRIADIPVPLGPTNVVSLPDTALDPYPWVAPSTSTIEEDWYVEESRIRGGFNNTSTDLGVKAYIVEDNDAQQRRSNSLIYSGIFNSRTGINQSNQFSIAEEITRSVDPTGGSIQKLYAEDTNLIIFQEDKVNRALIDKDAIYSAEGGAITTTANLVIGQIIAYAGEYGISTNPESFAVYGYQKYFVDRNRNCVLRLSRDGISEISSYGMIDFFRDKLALIGSTGSIIGSYDIYNKNYVLSLQYEGITLPDTLSFEEATNGWVSFYDYKPSTGFSSQGKYFTTNLTTVYEHYVTKVKTTQNPLPNVPRNSFYGAASQPSILKFIFNPDPTIVKTFSTVNYEGSNGWEVTSLISDQTGAQPFVPQPPVRTDGIFVEDTSQRIYSYDEGLYTEGGISYRAGFDRKQNRYMAAIKNSSTIPVAGQVLVGPNNTGIKAYYATVTMKTDATTFFGEGKQLFAVGATYGR
jgi:hypothetical protein